MPAAPLPFVNNLHGGYEELSGASPQAINVVIDGAGTLRRRPGIGSYFNEGVGITGGSVIGLHAAESGAVFAVRDSTAPIHHHYRIAPGGAVSIGTRVGTSRPVFVETEMLLVIANGQEVSKIELATPTSVSALGGSPPHASHVIFNNLGLLVNDVDSDRSAFRYSSPASGTTSYAGFENWTPFAPFTTGSAGFRFASAAPDPIVALGETVNEVWAFGSRTLQLFAPDTTYVYQPTSAMEVGCSAPYSPVKREGEYYWLDHARRFVKSAGRGTEVLSKEIHATLQGLSRVDDCYGYRVLVGPVDGIAWTFPTDGRTFFIQDGAGWSQWASWNSQSATFRPFAVTSHAYDRATGQNLVGIEENVGQLRMNLAADLTFDDIEPIVAQVTTGFLNQGTDARKICRAVRLTFRHGSLGRAPELRGTLEWRDAPGPWEPALPVVVDGMNPVCDLRALGSYRRRQWRYTFSDSAEDLVLAGAEIDFEVTD